MDGGRPLPLVSISVDYKSTDQPILWTNSLVTPQTRRRKGILGNKVLLFVIEGWLVLVEANECFPHNQEECHNNKYNGSDVQGNLKHTY